MPGLERQRLAVGAVADDPLQHLRDDDGPVGLVVDPVEQLAQLRLGEEEAEVLVAVAVHRHADAVGERGQRDDHLGVRHLHPVVGDHRRLDPVLGQLAQELERDVRDDLDVHPGVVVDLETGHGVDVRDVPPALQLVVAVHAPDQPAELLVAAHRDVDPHARDRLGGREPGLALGFDGDRDPGSPRRSRARSPARRSPPPEHTSASIWPSSGRYVIDPGMHEDHPVGLSVTRRPAPLAAHGLLPADPRDPAHPLVRHLVGRDVLRRDRRLGGHARHRAAAGRAAPLLLRLHPLRHALLLVPLPRHRARTRPSAAGRSTATRSTSRLPDPAPQRRWLVLVRIVVAIPALIVSAALTGGGGSFAFSRRPNGSGSSAGREHQRHGCDRGVPRLVRVAS